MDSQHPNWKSLRQRQWRYRCLRQFKDLDSNSNPRKRHLKSSLSSPFRNQPKTELEIKHASPRPALKSVTLRSKFSATRQGGPSSIILKRCGLGTTPTLRVSLLT